jgi:hypothetical protein
MREDSHTLINSTLSSKIMGLEEATRMRIKIFLMGFFLAVCLSVQADVSIGGSAGRGMGGAGLALTGRPAQQSFLNPAALAYVKGFRFGLGNFDLDSEGASFGTLYDELQFFDKNPFSLDKTSEILRRFARKDTLARITADLGVMASGGSLSVGGIAEIHLVPNQALKDWARSGQGAANIPSNAQGDALGVLALSLPDIAGGIRLPMPGGDLAVGARVRLLRVYYTHYFADGNTLRNSNAGLRAPEMGGRDFLDKTTTGVDFGLLWHSKETVIPFSVALVIENLVEPDAKFNATDVQGNAITLKPLRRATHLGFASELSIGFTVALDFIDISNATGRNEVRLGIEQRLPGNVALRAGYASRNRMTVGAGIGGFNLAYSDKFPMLVSRTLKF